MGTEMVVFEAFEEKFPSMRGMWVWANHPYGSTTDCSPQFLYLADVIEKNCIDKQRVREALQKCVKDRDTYDEWFDEELFIKELGL